MKYILVTYLKLKIKCITEAAISQEYNYGKGQSPKLINYGLGLYLTSIVLFRVETRPLMGELNTFG